MKTVPMHDLGIAGKIAHLDRLRLPLAHTKHRPRNLPVVCSRSERVLGGSLKRIGRDLQLDVGRNRHLLHAPSGTATATIPESYMKRLRVSILVRVPN